MNNITNKFDDYEQWSNEQLAAFISQKYKEDPDAARKDPEVLSAKEYLITMNEALIHKLVNQCKVRGLTSVACQEEDLLQTARLAMTLAAEKYNEKCGKFITYAYTYVMGMLQNEAFDRKSPVSVSRQTYLTVAKKAKEGNGELLNRFSAVSLNNLIRHDQDGEEFMESINAGDTVQEDMKIILMRQMIDKASGILTKAEKRALYATYGIEDHIPRTEQEVADMIGTTRQNVNSLKQSAIRKMGRIMRKEGFNSFADFA
jgi:RNA polymerase sigma factor (sigma-70 family)